LHRRVSTVRQKMSENSAQGRVSDPPLQLTQYICLYLALLLIFGVYLSSLAPSITWGNWGSDSAELALAAEEAGIAHPPGYPTYVLLAHLWHIIPLANELALRLNFFSLFWALIACAVLMRLCQKILRKYDLNRWGIVFAGLILAFAPIVWSQAIITEVYSMGLAFLSQITLLYWDYQEKGGAWRLIVLGILIGAAYGVTPTIVLCFVLIGLLTEGYKTRLLLIFGVILGLSVFLYLPLRAAQNPIANWGRASSWEQFWWMISARQYQQFWQMPTLSGLGQAMLLVALNLQVWGLIPSFAGLYWMFRHERRFAAFLLSILGFSLIQTMAYRVDGYAVYLIPAIFVLTLCLGIGSAIILKRPRIYLFIALGLVTIHLVLWYPLLNRSQDDAARQFAVETLSQLPENAVVLSYSDGSSFALWYGQRLLNRNDIIIIDARLLLYDWYIENLLLQHPTLERRWLRYGGISGLPNPLYEVQGELYDYRILTFHN
jgi:hypothetical protein